MTTKRVPRPHRIRPADWDRMSWHQQSRAWRNWLDVLQDEKPEPPPAPPATHIDEYSRQAIHKICAALERELVAAHLEARRRGKKQPEAAA